MYQICFRTYSILKHNFDIIDERPEDEKEPTLDFLSLLKPICHLSGLDFDDSTNYTSEHIGSFGAKFLLVLNSNALHDGSAVKHSVDI